MPANENTIVFNYNAKNSVKFYFRFGLAILLIMFVVGIVIGFLIHDNWKESLLITLKCVGFVFPVTLLFWIFALIEKRNLKKNLTITISPEGITDAKGRLIPIGDIEHCHLVYQSTTMGTMDNNPSVTVEDLLVQLKSGKKKKIKIKDFDIPACVKSPNLANDILGIPLFTKREVIHVHYRADC